MKSPNTPHTPVDDRSPGQDKERGQSFLETALFLPLLLLLIAGMVEVGAYALNYLILLDASREGARYGANLDPGLTSMYPFDRREGHDPFPDVRAMTPEQLLDVCNNGRTTNFYYSVACVTYQNIPVGTLDPTQGDDIVITVFRVNRTGQLVGRWPLTPTHVNPSDWGYHFRGRNDGEINPSCTTTDTVGCRSWSLYGVRTSRFGNNEIVSRLAASRLQDGTTAPATGFVVVEVYHAQSHFTGMFSIGDFIPDPVNLWAYTIFPVPAAEPR